MQDKLNATSATEAAHARTGAANLFALAESEHMLQGG
jgi:hypothetical protein